MMHLLNPHVYCHFCGTKYSDYSLEHNIWPRKCDLCGHQVWKNPLPVVVVVIHVGDPGQEIGLLAVRRSTAPDIGKLTFPSGYMEEGEIWREAALRELKEETGITKFTQADLGILDVCSSFDKKHLLIFCMPYPRLKELPKFESNEEVSELVVIHNSDELIWSSHQEIAKTIIE